MNKVLVAFGLLSTVAFSSAQGDDFCSKLRTVKDCAESSCRWIDAEQRCTAPSNLSLTDENLPSEELALPAAARFELRAKHGATN